MQALVFIAVTSLLRDLTLEAMGSKDEPINRTIDSDVKRQWPESFDTFGDFSGSGSGNDSEPQLNPSYADTVTWTVVTQTVATYLPTFTMVKVTTPVFMVTSVKLKPAHKSIEPTNVVFDSIKASQLSVDENENNSLVRRSIQYLGPSSSLFNFLGTPVLSDQETVSPSLHHNYWSPSLSLSSVTYPSLPSSAPASASPSTAALPFPSPSPSSSYYSFPSTSVPTTSVTGDPIHYPETSFTVLANGDKATHQSSSRYPPRDVPNDGEAQQTPTPLLPNAPISMNEPQYAATVQPTIPVSASLSEGSVSSDSRQAINSSCGGRPFDEGQPSSPQKEYYVRSVIYRTGVPAEMTNITLYIEERLKQAYQMAYERQLRDLGLRDPKVKVETLSKNITLSLHNIILDKSNESVHFIYSVEQNGQKLLGTDVTKVLQHITVLEMENILGAPVASKAEPYSDFDRRTLSTSRLTAAGQRWDWLGISLISASVILLLFCLVLGLILWRKNKSFKKKLVAVVNSELNRVAPAESYTNWRRVSEAKSRDDGDPNNEFEYVSFAKPMPLKKKAKSKGVQSGVRMVKEKVVPIGVLSDSENGTRSHLNIPINPKITYLTTRKEMVGDFEEEEGYEGEETGVPQIVQVHLSEQTQSIIKAIRSELRKFNHQPVAFPPPVQGSYISNFSEA